ncbi:hypothetical protein EOJ36_07475 [Sandaracinomonas limnophila]|uniref:DUF6089 domain-containing protein n=1 Tax=Sandaracinomonas limnophila TaxID=1862386 RepID=A0A437PRI3_9BACT|nr:DUF6089 family protein [Sandaracinomonas limnophila]RVU24840.1 hypothetical protein EOJ36_07475 [Sandaracinomonas limnophila]
MQPVNPRLEVGNMLKLKTIFFLLFIAQVGFSQTRYYLYGLGVGLNGMKGDIQSWNMLPSAGILKTLRPTVHGEVGIQLNTAFDLRIRASIGMLSGDANVKQLPNIRPSDPTTFNSVLTDVNFLGDYNFLDFTNRKDSKVGFTPYFVGGLGYYFESGEAATKFKSSSPTLNYGMGIKWKVNRLSLVRIEGLAKKTFNDKLDGIEIPKTGTDQYLTLSISYVYYIPVNICPALD